MSRTFFQSAGLFLLAPLLFASNMVAARWIGGDFPPFSLALGRWLIAAVVLWPMVRLALRRHRDLLRHRVADLALLAILGGALSVAPQYAAAQHTSAGHIALVFALTPVLVSLIDRAMWRVALAPAVIIGACVSFSGIGVAVFEGNPQRLLDAQFNEGDLLALVAVLAWSGYTALLRRRPVGLPPLVLLWVVAAGGALVLVPAAGWEAWSGGGLPKLTLRAAGGMVFVALVAGLAAYQVYARLIARLGAAPASMAMYLVPVYAFVMSAILLGEPLQPYHFVATGLVFLGVSMATMAPRHIRLGRRAAFSFAESVTKTLDRPA